jgi:hypothetical protein
MENLQFMIFDNMFIIVIAVFILFFLVGQVRKKKVKETYEKNVKEAEAEANKYGLNVSKEMPNISAMSYDLSHGVDTKFGDTIYEGVNDNIKWKLVSTVKYSDDTAIGSNRRDLIQQTLKYTTYDIKLNAHNYVMMMEAPTEMKIEASEDAGFMSSIKNFVAEKALDYYVGNYFGNEYKDMINISDGTIIRNNSLRNFLIITNSKQISDKIIDEKLTEFILDWHNKTKNFKNESFMKTPGLLIAPDKFILTCQSSVVSAKEASEYAEICSEISNVIKTNYGW